MKQFSIGQVISEAFDLTKRNFKLLVLLILFVMGVYILPQILQLVLEASLGENSVVVSIVLVVISAVMGLWLQPVLQLGLSHIYLKLADGQQAAFLDIFARRALWIKYLVATFLYSLIGMGIVAGMGLLIVLFYFAGGLASDVLGIILGGVAGLVGIVALVYVSTRYLFFNFVIPDKQVGAVEALKTSWNMTRGNVGKLIGLSLVLALINLVGLLALGVGLLFTAPMSIMAQIKAYKHLS